MAHPRRRRMAGLNRMVLAILRTPLRFLLDPGICELSYRGKRTATLARAGSDEFARGMSIYTRRFRDMSPRPGDRLVIITLQH